MQTRRAALATLAGVCTAALAGCSLFEDGLQREAEPAAVADEAVGATAFEHDGLAEQVHEETVEVAGESRDLRLTNWINRYTMSVSAGDFEAARFSLFTTPTVTVAGESANPFGLFDRERLVRAMVDRLDTGPVEDVRKVRERTVAVLGEDVTVDEFDARTEQGGVSLRLHMGDLTSEGDLLVLLGLHPDRLDLTGDVDTLAEGVLHPTERP